MRSSRPVASVSLILMLAALIFVQSADACVRSGTPPEALLVEDTALYFRFDGLKPHQTAYEQTIFSRLMKDEFGPLVDFVSRAIVDAFGPDIVAEQLIDGLEPAQLLELHRAARKLPQLLTYLDEHGIVVGLEVARQPKLRWQLTLVFPNGAEQKRRVVLFGTFLLLGHFVRSEVTAAKESDRSILTFETDELGKAACWQEGRHVIWTVGTAPFSNTLALIQGKRRNLTESPEFKRVAGFKRYETYARGFVHLNRILAFIQGDSSETDEFLNGLGLNGITNINAHLGFEGRNQRQTFVLNTSGPRKGLLGLVSAKSTLQLEELPPLPPDAASVSARAIEPGDFFAGAARMWELMLWLFDADPLEFRESVQGIVKSLETDVRRDFLDSLDSKVVISNTPSEGPLLLGTAVLVRVKDARKLEKTFPAIAKSITKLIDAKVHVRRRLYRGADLYMFEIEDIEYATQFPIIPTLAIHDGWFAIGFFPQVVQGFIARSSGKYRTWKPAPLLSQQLQAAMVPDDSGDPGDGSRFAAFSQTNPRFWAKLMLSLAPTGSGSSDSNSLLQFVRRTSLQTYAAIDSLQEIVNLKKVDRPGYYGGWLPYKLGLIASMIRAGFGTRLFYVAIGGFDTHSQQKSTQDSLLTELARAIGTFFKQLNKSGDAKRVLLMTYSEFGRRVRENGSEGTDHGAASNMFLVGPKVRGGLIGEHPSLEEDQLDNGDLSFHTDFRRVYATVLDRWLRSDSRRVLGSMFPHVDFLS